LVSKITNLKQQKRALQVRKMSIVYVRGNAQCDARLSLIVLTLLLLRCTEMYEVNYTVLQQELSYRKQIARQLRTRYVEGIYRSKYYTVTLKSGLRVTQGHWKRNYWIDHTTYS